MPYAADKVKWVRDRELEVFPPLGDGEEYVYGYQPDWDHFEEHQDWSEYQRALMVLDFYREGQLEDHVCQSGCDHKFPSSAEVEDLAAEYPYLVYLTIDDVLGEGEKKSLGLLANPGAYYYPVYRSRDYDKSPSGFWMASAEGWGLASANPAEIATLAGLYPDAHWKRLRPQLVHVLELDGKLVPPPRLDVAMEVYRMMKSEHAKAYVQAQRAGASEIPALVSLGDLLAAEMPEEQFVIEGLMPTDGNVLLAAQRKAGKSTTVHNLARSLVDGDPFLDHFTVNATRRVALLDFELSSSTLQRWLGEQKIRNQDALRVMSLRGRASAFNILDDKVRARWADILSGVEVLIVDPLRPIFDALGLNEWNEAGPFLQAFAALREEAGISEGVLVHHHGHHAERAAGDSRLEGTPDVVWNYTRENTNDPQSFRYFQAFGRDVDVDKGLVSIYDGHRLAFAPGVAAAKLERTVELLLSAMGDRELTTTQVAELGVPGINKNSARKVLERALGDELLTVEQRGTSKVYRVA
jgi:hypothetical protein